VIEIETDVFGNPFWTYIESPFNYTGSKYDLLPQLQNYLPKVYNDLWDVFCGGGSIFINLMRNGLKTHCNDIVTPLIQFYQFLQSNDWKTIEETLLARNISDSNHEAYNELRKRYNDKRDCIDFFILVCSCTNNMMRFNQKGEFNQTWGQRHYSDWTRGKLKGYWRRIYNDPNIIFSNKDFFECTPNVGDFVYLDPPYAITGAGYNTTWSEEHEKRLYDYLDELDEDGIHFMMSNVSKHKGKENPYMCRVKKYNVVSLKFDYDVVSRNGKSESEEIIVMNY